jgi:predicted Zn-dependent peptidase
MTVIEEKKQSYDNRPYGKAHLRFDELAYSNWAYAHSIIGLEEDLHRATLADAQTFHRTYYGPGNAVLVVAGEFDEAQARELIRRHFEPIEDATAAQPPELAEPMRDSETYEEMIDPLAALPAVATGYQMPSLGSPEYYALSMLALVLADGDSSRFYRRFVYDNSWITGLFAGPNQYKGPEIFRIWFQVREDVTPEVISHAVDEELHRLATDRVSAEELEKARNQVTHRYVNRLARVSQIGEYLAQSASVFENTASANEQLELLLSVSTEQIRNTAAVVFQPANRTRILVRPGGNS